MVDVWPKKCQISAKLQVHRFHMLVLSRAISFKRIAPVTAALDRRAAVCVAADLNSQVP